ncbi:hypothetical protein CR513_60272, partial [Mucuna pruriens]
MKQGVELGGQLYTSDEDISIFAGDSEVFDCLRFVIDKADYDELWEVHNLFNSKDDITNLADLSQEAKLLNLLDHVCKHEDPECSNNEEVRVVGTKKLLSAQVATMFTTEHESAEVDSARKTSVEVDLSKHVRVESNSASEDRKQVEVEFVSDNNVQKLVPTGSDFSIRKNNEFDSNPTRVGSNSANMNRPQKRKVEIMLAQLVLDPHQVATDYTTATAMTMFMFQSNNRVLSGSFVRLTIRISLRYSYDDRQTFVHCHTEELCNRYLISWQGLNSS